MSFLKTKRAPLGSVNKKRAFLSAGLGAALILSFWPEPSPPAMKGALKTGFVWEDEERFRRLEKQFLESSTCPDDAGERLAKARRRLNALLERRASVDDEGWTSLENDFFDLSSVLGTCPPLLQDLLQLREDLRGGVKELSRGWGSSSSAQDRLYRLLYGSRAAVEELSLQVGEGVMPALSQLPTVPSKTPSTEVYGVRIHSGDILLSRGGAPTSAYIARGNEHPGNFSHAALVHVDEDTAEATIIEAHIERGVVISTLAEYIQDQKLRILVLRLHPEHPALQKDELLPHRVAERAREAVLSRHIPYDFTMNFEDASRQFCSEVVSTNYRDEGVHLWTFYSSFARTGLARWMGALGVRYLETHGPADLEYDPQVQVVAEWLDQQSLREAHLANAVIDAMLDEADQGQELEHQWILLPVVRLMKAYSVVLNWAGGVGPIPEGMSATVALRVRRLSALHDARVQKLRKRAELLREKQGYYPPYWKLVQMAASGFQRRK